MKIHSMPHTVASGLVPFYLESKGIDTIPKQIDGVWKKIVTARINQTSYEIICDEILELLPEVVEILTPLLKK
jgi:hypothetical protein